MCGESPAAAAIAPWPGDSLRTGTSRHQEEQPWAGPDHGPQIGTTPQHVPGTEDGANSLHQGHVLDSSVIAPRA